MFYSLLVYYRRDTDKVFISILGGLKEKKTARRKWKDYHFLILLELYRFIRPIKKS